MTDFNILCDRLPHHVTVDGIDYTILTDFRRWILMLDLFDCCRESSADRMDPITAARCALRIVMPKYSDPGDLPADTLIKLLEKLAVFALGGITDAGGTSDATDRDDVQVIDFCGDAEVILSSFLIAYGIDLTKTSMHWWKFLALLRALPPDTPLMRIIDLRTCDTTKIEDDAVRRRMRRAKAAVRIRQPEVSRKRNQAK